MRSLRSLHENRASGPQNFGHLLQNDFCNTIGAKRTYNAIAEKDSTCPSSSERYLCASLAFAPLTFGKQNEPVDLIVLTESHKLEFCLRRAEETPSEVSVTARVGVAFERMKASTFGRLMSCLHSLPKRFLA
jgi:hypothetical protein